MDCLYTLMGPRVRQNMLQSQDAAVFQAASTSTAFSYENIFHDGLAEVGGYTLRTDPAVHSKTWPYVHANADDIEHDDKSRPMLIPTNNDPVAMDAVGFPVIWRDSP